MWNSDFKSIGPVPAAIRSCGLCCISGTGCFRAKVAHDSHSTPSGGPRMKRLYLKSFLVVSMLALGTVAQTKGKPAPAAGSPLVMAIDRCRQMTDPAQRLACYDSAAAALAQCDQHGRGQHRRPGRSEKGPPLIVRLQPSAGSRSSPAIPPPTKPRTRSIPPSPR